MVLAARRPDLHEALRRAAADGWAFVILDGKLFDYDRVTETVLSVKGDSIDAWYSGKHRDFGANIQALMLPNGFRSGPPSRCPAIYMTCLAPKICTSPPP